MIRTGHPRARGAVRDRRFSALAAIVMLLLALGAILLVSAGSPHHRPGTPADITAAVVAAPGDGAAAQPAAHEHEHGNDWVPTLSKRIRPAATAAVVTVLTVRTATAARAPGRAAAPASGDSGNDLFARGVLRV